MTGSEIKQLILSANVKCWKVAELWGCTDSTFSRRLRKPFDDAEVQRVKDIISAIKSNEKPAE